MKIPSYQIIFNDYEAKIRHRQLLPGTRLASESELCRQYDVSRITVRKALSMLSDQHLIRRVPGVGSFVSDRLDPELSFSRKPVTLGVEFFPVNNGLANTFYYAPIQRAIHDAAATLSCQTVLLPREELLAAPSAFDGRIFYSLEPEKPEELEQLRATGAIPTILINRIVTTPNIGYVAVDYRETAARLVGRLLDNGAADVAIVGSSNDPQRYSPYQRTLGWREAYLARRGRWPEELSCDVVSIDRGSDELVRLFERPGFDAVFVVGGATLPATVAAVARAGRSIPEDICIICFDHVEDYFSQLGVPISFIRQPLAQMSFMATEHLARRARGEVSSILHQIFPASLIATNCKFLF